MTRKTHRRQKRILIVTDSKQGIKQTQDKLLKYAAIKAGAYYEDEKDLSKQVTVTTYHSWQSKDFPIDPEDVDLLAIDEAHRSITEARRAVIDKYQNAVLLALTATPTYDEERDLLKYFELGYRMTIEQAVMHGLISSFRNVVLNSNVDVDLDKIGIVGEDFKKSDLEKALNIEARNRIAAKYIVFGTHFDTGQPIREIPGLGNCGNKKHSRKFAEVLNEVYNEAFPDKPFEKGFAQFIAGDTKNRDEILQWHQEGKTQYLIFADLLLQNYDDERIGVIVNLRPTKAIVLAVQRGGRTERIDKNNPGKISLIVDVFDRYKGKFKQQPLFYAHAVNYPFLITNDAAELAKERSLRFSSTSDLQSEGAEKAVEKMKFNIVTDEKSILNIFKGNVFREKTDQDLDIVDVMVILHLSNFAVYNGFAQLRKEWGQHLIAPNENSIPVVRLDKVLKSSGSIVHVLPKEDLALFKTHYLRHALEHRAVVKKTSSHLTPGDVAYKLGLQRSDSVVKKFKQIEQEWALYWENPEVNLKPLIYIELVRPPKGPALLAINAEQFEDFKKNYLNTMPSESKEEYLIAEDIATDMGLGYRTVLNALRRARKDIASLKPGLPLEIEITKIKGKNGKPAEAIKSSQLEAFKNKYLDDLVARPKKLTDLTVKTVSEIIKINSKILTKEFDELYELQKSTSHKSVDFKIEKARLARGAPFNVISIDELVPFLKSYHPDKSDKFLNQKNEILAQLFQKDEGNKPSPKPE